MAACACGGQFGGRLCASVSGEWGGVDLGHDRQDAVVAEERSSPVVGFR